MKPRIVAIAFLSICSFAAGLIAAPIVNDFVVAKSNVNKSRTAAHADSNSVDAQLPRLIEEKKAAVRKLRLCAAQYQTLQEKYHPQRDAENLHLLFLKALCLYLADDFSSCNETARGLLSHPLADKPSPLFDHAVPKDVIAELIRENSRAANLAVTGGQYYVSITGGVKIRTAKEANELTFGTADMEKYVQGLKRGGIGGGGGDPIKFPERFKLPPTRGGGFMGTAKPPEN
jgi:hypothetical protein